MTDYSEPWIACGNHFDDCRGRLLGGILGAWDEDRIEAQLAAMHRLVACVNACAGIPTEDLVSGKARVVRE